MSRKPRLVAPLLVALAFTLPACVVWAPGGPPPQATPAPSTEVLGTLLAPPGFLGNASGNFLGSASGNLTAQRRVRHAGHGGETDALGSKPLVGAEVFIADGTGTPIPGLKPVETDALGHFRLRHVPAGLSLMLVARTKAPDGRDVPLRALLRTGVSGATDVLIAPSTTFVTAAVVSGQAALGDFNVSAYDRAVFATNGGLAPGDEALLGDVEAMTSKLRVLAGTVRELDAAVGALRGELAEVKTSLAELTARVDQLAAAASPPPALPAVTPLASYGVGAAPRNLVFDREGNAWVANYKDDTVSKLSPAGAVLGTYPVGGYPVGLAVDASGNVWVANYSSNNVMKLGPDGARLGTYATDTPFGLAVDPAGNAWVANYKAKTVSKLAPDGKVLGAYATEARPFGVAVVGDMVWVSNNAAHSLSRFNLDGLPVNNPIRIDREPHWVVPDRAGNVWVTATASGRLDRLDASGTVLGSYDVGAAQPWGLAVAPDGAVWVTTQAADSYAIVKFGADGAKLGAWALPGRPQGLAVDAQGNPWVTLQESNAVVKTPAQP